MSLLDRLTGLEAPKLPVHQFWAALTEFQDGAITKAQLISEFSLAGTDVTELDWLISKYQASTNKENFVHRIHSLFCLAEFNHFNYNDKATMQARINALP